MLATIVATVASVGCSSSSNGSGSEPDPTATAIAVAFEGYDGTPLEEAVGTYETAAEAFRETVSIDGPDVTPEPAELRSEVRTYRAALFDLDAAIRAEVPPSRTVNAVLRANGVHIANLDELMTAADDEIVELAGAAADTGDALRAAADALAEELTG